MSIAIFTSAHDHLRELCKTKASLQFMQDLYLIFHQIYLYRFQNISLDVIGEDIFFPPIKTDSLDEYHKNIILGSVKRKVRENPILHSNFELFNSYEKISFENFVKVMRVKYSGFDGDKFGAFLLEYDPADRGGLEERFLSDFCMTQAAIDYMNEKHNRF